MRIALNAGAIESLLGDHRDGAAGCETDVRREHAQEQMPTRRPGASLANVSNDGLADAPTSQHDCLAASPTVNENLASAPIDSTHPLSLSITHKWSHA